VDTSLDGNAAAGALADLFAFDVTMAVSTCAACRDPRPVAELRAYLDAPGIVLRCASCGATQLRLVRSGDRIWLDLRGIEVLEMRSPPPPTDGPAASEPNTRLQTAGLRLGLSEPRRPPAARRSEADVRRSCDRVPAG